MSIKRMNNNPSVIWLLISIILCVLAGFVRFVNAVNVRPFSTLNLLFWIEILIFGLISFSLAKYLVRDKDKQKKRYHLSFILPFVFSIGLGFWTMVNNPGYWIIPYLIFTGLSCFAGVFIHSNINLGWWENNAQPTPEMETAVLRIHLTSIGGIKNTGIQKRLFDITFAIISLVLSTPVWILIAFLIWWEDPGTVLFVKNAVGHGGVNFKQLKFRSMITNAESETGPISGYENDDRVLRIGAFIRKTALDELPQLINILLGDMSYVGPRPQRTVLVARYLHELPQFAARHQVKPGLAGLAQVVDNYDISPERKLAWDLVYIERANLRFDIQLALAAFYLVFVLRWRHTENPEEKIRALLNIQEPEFNLKNN